MTAIEHRVVPGIGGHVPSIDIAQTVHEPQIRFTLFVFHDNVHAHSTTRFHNEVLAESLRLVLVAFVVRKQLVPVEIRELGEVLHVSLDVQIQSLRQVKFKPTHKVVGRLQRMATIHRLILIRVSQLIRQFLRTGQKPIEQVDHITIRVGRDDVLRIHACRGLQSKPFACLVLDPKSWLGPHFGQRAVILHAQARLHNPIASLDGVIDVPAEFGGVFLLLHPNTKRVGGFEVRSHADDFNPVLDVVLTNDVLKIQPKIESLDFTEAIGRSRLVKVDEVIAQREMTVQQDRTSRRHDGEVSSSTNVAPPVIGKRHAGAVIQHAGKIVETEPKQAQLGTIPPPKRHLSIAIGEAEWQPAIVDVRIKQTTALLQVAVLQTQQVTDAPRVVFRHGAQGTIQKNFGSKRTGSHLTFHFPHVAILGSDVHDGTDAPAVFGRKRPRVHIGVRKGIGVEHAEQTNAMEGVVDQHAVQKDLVLDGRTTSDVELSPLVTRGHESRKNLQGLNQVRSATKARDALDVCWTNGLDRGPNLGGLFLPIGPDLSPIQGHDRWFQQEIAGQDFVVLNLDGFSD